jgi:hypothetical protein
MLGQHSDFVDPFGSLPIGDLERGGNGRPQRLIAGVTLRILLRNLGRPPANTGLVEN